MTVAELLAAISAREERGLPTTKAYMAEADARELRANFLSTTNPGPTGYFGNLFTVDIIQILSGEAFYE